MQRKLQKKHTNLILIEQYASVLYRNGIYSIIQIQFYPSKIRFLDANTDDELKISQFKNENFREFLGIQSSQWN